MEEEEMTQRMVDLLPVEMGSFHWVERKAILGIHAWEDKV